MRKLIVSMLLATSVAMPAMAQDRDGHGGDRGEQNASSEQRGEARAALRAERAEQGVDMQRPVRDMSERPQQVDRVDWSAREQTPQQAVQQQSGDQQAVRRGFEQQGGERRSNNDGMAAAIERQQAWARAREQGQADVQQRPDDRRDGRRRNGSVLGGTFENGRAGNDQIVVQHDRDDRAGSPNTAFNRQWSNHWRGDRNYDWRHYRNRNRSIFRLGNYWDPFGSSYRRFSIGFSLFPSYYQSNYWLNDPWMYRLPPVYGPYRWVRYYDDALLVNIYTGQVVDVVHSFFW